MGFYVPNHADYARTVASFLDLGVITAVLLLLVAYAASAGARLRGGRVTGASSPPARRQRGATARLRAGMTSGTGASPRMASARPGASFARSVVGGSRTDGPSLRP